MAHSFDQSLMHLLHRASQIADELFAGGSNRLNLTPRQFIVLAAIAQNEGLRQSNIVQETGVDRSTVADIVRRMMQNGLIAKERSMLDGRANAVNLTAQGRSVMKTGTLKEQQTNQTLLEKLAPEERRAFLTLLTKLVA